MATYQVETEDGVFEVEVADDSGPSMLDEAKGIRNRLIEGAGGLVDLVSAAERNLNPFRPGGPRAFGLNENINNMPPVETFTEGLKRLGSKVSLYDETKPQTDVGKILGEVAYYAPGAALPGGVLPSITGGASAGIAKVNDFGETGQAIAGLFGSLAPAGMKALATKASTIYDDLAGIFTKSGKQETATQKAANIVQELFEPKAAIQKIDDAAEATSKVPYIQRTSETYLPQYQRTAEVLDSPMASTLEESIKRTDLTAKEMAVAQDLQREAARKEIFNRLGPSAEKESVLGTTIREALEENKQTYSDLVSEFAGKAFKGNEEIIISPAKRTLTGKLNSFLKDGSRQVSNEFTNLVENFRSLPPKVDLKTLQNYRSSFGAFTELGPNATTVDKATASLAGQLRSSLDEAVNVAVEGTLPKQQAKAWREMIKTRAEKGALFELDDTAKVLEKAPYGAGYDLPAEEITKRVLSTKESAIQLRKAIAGKPEALEAAQGSLLAEVRNKSTNAAGEFMNAAYKRQLASIEEVAPEILTSWSRKALEVIGDDLASQASIRGKAYKVSAGQAVTSEAVRGIDAIQEAVKAASEGLTSKVVSKIPVIGDLLDTIVKRVSDPKIREQLINQELAKFVLDPKYAKQLLSTSPKEIASAVKAFKSQLLGTLGPAVQGATKIQNSEGIDSVFQKKKVDEPITDTMFKRTSMEKTPEIKAVEQEIDADPYYSALYETESGRNPNAKNPNSSAAGGFQFIKATAKSMGLDDPYDLRASFDAVQRFTDDHRARFGDDPATLYAAHYMGATLLSKLNAGKQLTENEQKIVESFERQALPRFMRILEKVNKPKTTMV